MSWELITIMVLIFLGEIAGTVYFYLYYKKLDNLDKMYEKLKYYIEEKIKEKFNNLNREKIIIIDDKKEVI